MRKEIGKWFMDIAKYVDYGYFNFLFFRKF